jgi:hypothetical protein
MKIIGIFANLVAIVLIAYLVAQGIPELISAKNDVDVAIGVGFLLLAIAVIYARGVEIYKDLKPKGEKSES